MSRIWRHVGFLAAFVLAGFLVLAQEAAHGEEEGGSFLVSPGLGLMIWTLVLFLITMWVLSKVAFPKIQEALDSAREKDLDLVEISAEARPSVRAPAAEVPQRANDAIERVWAQAAPPLLDDAGQEALLRTAGVADVAALADRMPAS